VVGLVLGVVAALLGGSVAGLAGGLVAGVPVGIVGGLDFGLLPGRHHAWLAYLIATYRLARGHRLPRRLMPFLDDMHRLGLLRAVGPFYQFRHAELQEHLAATHRARE
jgi:hypothetical protein